MDQAKKDELAERLEPTHLTSDKMQEAVRREVAEQAKEAKEGKEEDPEKDEKSQKEYPFDFSWTDELGKVWKGHFVNEIMDIRTMQLAGVQRARFALGMPIESMDDAVLGLNLMVAHLMYSLTEKPAWAEDLLALNDVNLIQKLFEEVSAHEDTFRGRKPAETTG